MISVNDDITNYVIEWLVRRWGETAGKKEKNI